MSAPSSYESALLHKARWRPLEFLVWAAAFALPFVMPSHSLLVNEIAIVALFAMSLDLILGYTGMLSLAQGVFFGIGAYASALLSTCLLYTSPSPRD